MDSDPVDPTSSVLRRRKPVIISDSEAEQDGSPRPPRRGTSERRRTIPESDPEEDEDSAESRERRNKGKGRAVPMDDDGEEEEDFGSEEGEGEVDDGRPLQTQYRPEYERHSDGYVTGSITRIKLIDFMTYDFVEFKPGPHLNMILGPNGTGKSTIAAGIAIGLGFKPEIMGRATDLKSYVKQGKEEAWTEIEVRAAPGKRNHVIWRRFTREEKSEWKLNGAPVTRKAIIELVGGFGIQANNLCCFLAQDRVAEFAKMSPPLTLKETMRAAGDPRLTEWHRNLVAKGNEKKILQEKLNGDISRRDQIQAQIDKIQPDVEQYENRQEQEKEQEILQVMVEAAKLKEIERKHAEFKQQRDERKRERVILKQSNEPLQKLITEQNRKESRSADKVKKTNAELRETMSSLKDTQGDLTSKLEICGKADDDLANLKRRIRRREQNKQSFLDRKAAAEAKLAEDEDALRQTMNEEQLVKKELTNRHREQARRRNGLLDQENQMKRDLERIGNDINAKMRRQTELEDVKKIRTDMAIQSNGSIGYVLEFIEKNGMKFEHPVGMPPIISVNVPQKQYAWQVEQCLSGPQRMTFIAQSKHDYDLLINLQKLPYPARTLSNGTVVPGGTVGIHLVTIDNVHEGNVNPPRFCSPQRMADLKLDGVALDYVEADPLVRAFLVENCNLHRAAVTQRASAELDAQTIAEQGFWTWLSRDESVRSIRSRYGNKAYQLSAQSPNQARFLDKAVDQEAVGKLVHEIAELKRRKVDCETPLLKLREDIQTSATQREKILQDIDANEKAIKRIRDSLNSFETARQALDSADRELEKIARQPSEAEERDKLQAEKMTKALACLADVNVLATSHETLATQASDSITAALGMMQNKVNIDICRRKYAEIERIEKRLDNEIEKLSNQFARVGILYQTAYQKFQGDVRSRSRAVKDEVTRRTSQYPGGAVPLEETQEALANATADLELSEGISHNVVERFRRFEKERNSLVKEVKEQENHLKEVTTSLTSILTKFEPALESLVDIVSRRFSTAFDRNGCSGDVRLDKDERGYEHWGLIPHVSFRDGEAMQALTGQRQSGGERSYSTIMYLMALSEMARVPFSLVDEINQGMDQQAERTVFNQLVETTCDANAGQYFLITPKLLTGLTYHERMKVLIVNNGYWLPEGTDTKQKFGDLRGCLKRYRKSIAA